MQKKALGFHQWTAIEIQSSRRSVLLWWLPTCQWAKKPLILSFHSIILEARTLDRKPKCVFNVSRILLCPFIQSLELTSQYVLIKAFERRAKQRESSVHPALRAEGPPPAELPIFMFAKWWSEVKWSEVLLYRSHVLITQICGYACPSRNS